MRRLTGQADHCRRLAARCRRDADRIKEPIFRAHLFRLAERWAALADSSELAEKVSGFLTWDAQRLDPPEAFHGGRKWTTQSR
jgi:hypothetical protein